MQPTDEQAYAVDLFSTGNDLVVEAGAGTGKTSTLVLMAEGTSRFGQYVAFNKAIVQDADKKMPKTVRCNTAHSLAYRAVGYRYKDRLGGARLRSNELADILGVKSFRVGGKEMAAGYLAGAVMRAVTNFCNSADLEPGKRHFTYIDGIDEPYEDGKRSYVNNDAVRAYLEPYLQIAWADLQRPDGRLPFKHEHYLKIWQLDGPRIDADFILFDEAQDANPVMQAIVAEQDNAQKIWVGDSQQQIYEFTGAVNAMAQLEAERAFLTQSWRFGQAVADKANEVLTRLNAPLQLKGHPGIDSEIGWVENPTAHLARTNGGAIARMFEEMGKGGDPHLVGGGADVIAFARGASALMSGNRTEYPELACFDDWAEVREYVENDQQGEDLRLMVSIMDRFGPSAIINALQSQPKEKDASLVVSTAHKAKGREWETVELATDFPPEDKINESELRLLYVAVTRAKGKLDLTGVPMLNPAPPNVDPETGEILPEPAEEKAEKSS